MISGSRFVGFHGRISVSGFKNKYASSRSELHWPGSTAADGDNDLELVAVGQYLLAKPAARHDLAIALERHALAGEVQILEQLLAVERLFEAAAYTVGQCDQSGPLFRLSPRDLRTDVSRN